MSVERIASRYAKSLIDLAVEQNKLEPIKRDIDFLNKVMKDADFFRLLKSPIVHADKKGEIFKAVFSGKVDDLTMSFLNLLLKKGRERFLVDITEEFNEQYKSVNQISTVKLITATKIDDSALATIKQKLIDSKITEKNVEMMTQVNPDLIGGFRIEFGDKLYDASVAHKLRLLRKEILNN